MRDLDGVTLGSVCDRKRPLVELFHQHAVAAPIVEQNPQLIAAPTTEHVQVTALRISSQLLAHHRHQTCDLSAHIAGSGVEEDAKLPIQPDHRSPSSARSQGAIAAASHVPANVTTRPFGNVTSTRRSAAP